MLQLNPPLVRVVVGGPGWIGPTGKGVANLIEPGHRDDDLVWIIDMLPNALAPYIEAQTKAAAEAMRRTFASTTA